MLANSKAIFYREWGAGTMLDVQSPKSSVDLECIKEMGGLDFCDLDTQGLSDVLIRWANEPQTDCVTVFPVNVDLFVQCVRDSRLHQLVQSATLRPCDGMPLLWTSHWLGIAIQHRVTGVDLIRTILASKGAPSAFFLGARPGVADEAARQLNLTKPGCIVGTYSPTVEELENPVKSKHIVTLIRQSRARLLVVGLGFPKQERWIHQVQHELDGLVVIAGGASIDFFAGKVKRAPLWIQRRGLEWAYRLIQEPRRLWRRYLFRDPWLLWWAVNEWRKQWKPSSLREG